MLSEEQIKEIRTQLLEQIQQLPEEKRREAEKQIYSLSPEALEQLVKQQSRNKGKSEKGIFRLIVDREIKSYIVDENTAALAVLDINPISNGHVIIIPKKPVTDIKQLPTSVFVLAKKIAKRITSKLKANSAEIQTETKFGEVTINIIPSYERPLNINSTRYQAKESELEEIADKLRKIRKPKTELIKKEKKKEVSEGQVLKLKRRIP